jgi:tetratricopeptide (TPR) repeat protein
VARVGNYELLGTLGHGAMGTVHRARHAATGREVAVKVVRVADDLHAKRLMREAELASRLDHPGIVRVFDAGRHGPVVFVVFELIEGARPLEQVLPELDQRRRVGLIRDVARALGHAHQRGVVHRDVKAGNVLVDALGNARLTDFGIGTSSDLDRLTRSGALVGTPRTMAPEQAGARRQRIGPPTDVWALGVMLHEALVDEHPVFGRDEPDSIVEVLAQIAQGAERGPCDVNPRIPAALDQVVRRALAFEPEERFPDGEAMALALDEALAAGRRRGQARAWTTPQVALLVVAVLGVGAAAGVAASGLLRSDPAPAVAPGPAPVTPSAPVAPVVVTPASAEDARGLVKRAAARAAQAPAEAARDLASALRLDPRVDAREAALAVASACATLPDDGALQEALAAAPGDVAAEAWIVHSIRIAGRGSGRSARALAALERAHERAATPVMRGEVLVRLGRFADASAVLRGQVDDAVVGPAARMWLAAARHDAAEAQGELTRRVAEEAVKALDDVTRSDPTLFRAWALRALWRAELEDEGAVDDAQRACDLAPAAYAAELAQLAGCVHYEFASWADAARRFDAALALDEDLFIARKRRGYARMGLDDWRHAIEDLERLDRGAGRNDPEVIKGLIESRLAVGERTGMRAQLERLRQLEPSATTDAWCAGVLAEVGDLVGAEARLDGLLADEAVDADTRALALALRVRVRVERGRASAALPDAEQLVALAPETLRAHTALALARVATGDPAGAQASIRAAVGGKVLAGGDAAMLFISDAWSIQSSGGDLARALELADACLTSSDPPYALALAVRVLIRRSRGDLDGARADARELLARMAEAPHDAWTVRVAREVLGS